MHRILLVLSAGLAACGAASEEPPSDAGVDSEVAGDDAGSDVFVDFRDECGPGCGESVRIGSAVVDFECGMTGEIRVFIINDGEEAIGAAGVEMVAGSFERWRSEQTLGVVLASEETDPDMPPCWGQEIVLRVEWEVWRAEQAGSIYVVVGRENLAEDCEPADNAQVYYEVFCDAE